MGAQQSSGQNGSPEASKTAKTCYYDLLDVDRQASEEEIKKAYRRKALELHPDRNLSNVEVATQRFAEVQSAYEILSDPQERAWYDSHRDAILSGYDDGGDASEPATFHNVRLTSVEEIMTLIRRFNATVPFNDEPTGFFGILRETFEHLAVEEEAAATFINVQPIDYPTFGSANDAYEPDVKTFYAVWTSFSSKKTFSWKDKYRLSDAPDRRVRRMMEKENKKGRDEGLRDFNDTVRFLVGFVRKRDPRYVPNNQTEVQRQAAIRSAAAAQAIRSRLANQEKMSSFRLPDWVQPQGDDFEGESSSQSEEELELEVLECVVCNKVFKSDGQLKTHERSKKHTKAVQQLRWQMRKEGYDLDLEADGHAEELSPSLSSDDVKSQSLDLKDHQDRFDELGGTMIGKDGISNDCSEDIATHAEKPNLLHPNDAGDEGDEALQHVNRERAVSDATVSDIHSTSDDVELKPDIALGNLSITESHPQKKVGMARIKREKKASRTESQNHRCSTCRKEFASRTKLFKHIRDEGHKALLQPTGASTGLSKKNRT